MEWKIEVKDLLRFTKATENHFPLFLKYASDTSDPDVKGKLAVVTLDANSVFERYIADLGFCSLEEAGLESKQQTRSLLARIEHLHGAANETKKGIDFVSGLDFGTLQEELVEIFLYCLDQDLNYVVNRLREIALFETLLKCLLRDSPNVSWVKWQFDLTGSANEGSQVPEISHEHGVSLVHVNPEYDIMLSVSHIALGLSDQEQALTYAKYPGFFYLCAPAVLDNSEHLTQLLILRDSKFYLSASKFKDKIFHMLDALKVLSAGCDVSSQLLEEHKSQTDQGEITEIEDMEDFKIRITPHGPAVQVDEIYGDEDPYLSYDVVPAIKFSGWPNCSQDWITRKRVWPPQDLVEEIIQEGFHIVPKTSPHGDEELEWRISFSKAEVKLMNAKGLGNRNYCYRMFKLAIKENIISTCKLISTYHLKTLLLWASERHSPNRWSDENIAVCFLGLLDDLLHSLVNCSCPHYFIPELNLFADCSRDHLYFLASQVSAIRRFPLKYLKRPGEDPKAGYDNFVGAMKEWKEMDYGEL